MDYYFFIDETGSFNHFSTREKRRISRVGGYVCNNDNKKKIYENLIRLRNEKNLETLHFRELIFDKKEVIEEAIQENKNNIIFSFISVGVPLIIIHPQQYYIECLLAVLIESIEKLLKNVNDVDSINIEIAYRRHILEEIDGNRLIDNGTVIELYRSYDKIIEYEIKKILSKKIKKINLNVSLLNANRNENIQFADIIIGCLNNAELKTNFDRDLSLRVDVVKAYERYFSDNIKTLMKSLVKEGMFNDAIKYAFVYKNDKKLQKLSEEILNKHLIEKLEQGTFSEQDFLSIEYFLQELSDNDNLMYSENISKLKDISNNILETFNNKDNKNYLRIKEKCLYILMNWETHTGNTCENYKNTYAFEYENFLINEGSNIFKNIPEKIITQYETILRTIQTYYFNSFKFEEAIEKLEGYIDKYETFIDAFKNKQNEEQIKDDIMARLYGTIGQSYAFLGSLNNDIYKLKEAKEYLLLDLNNICKSNKYYAQGLSFLITLLWELEEIQEIEENLSSYYGIKKNENDIKNFLIQNKEKLSNFQVLDFIRYINLFEKKKGKLLSDLEIDELKNYFFRKENYYPVNLILKWISIFYLDRNNQKVAIELLNKKVKSFEIIQENFFNTLFETNRLLLLNYLDQNVINKLISKIDKIEIELLKNKALKLMKEKDYRKIAKFLPYYYG
ncbi:MAG: hypothetical protein XD76_0584 [candidate division TA06 bacterium 32_111]|uniref:DUF3800 domain-containing protein n=1 Tax=candidate division WOR-3 bacterium TaxID=2052148 RepID=A0A348MLK1_UNCW3|nr:MAG: hypothetical protein XD76_0584 [candidate division TA06 bacterium 32_111]HAF07927.1 hypothetical protein [candidate division WOR-3 bacterium]HCP16371.1 hypothetical protein [candidate division WOR-3 bacterium]